MIANCPLCHSEFKSNLSPYPKTKSTPFFDEIANCKGCDSGIAIPHQNQEFLNKYYESGQYWENSGSKAIRLHNFCQSEYRVKYLLKNTSIKSTPLEILDIGAGYGQIGKAFEKIPTKISFIYYFFEPDPILSSEILKSIESAKKVELDNISNTFDIIFLNHILEHTANPTETLEFYKQFLKPDGVIYIEVPNRDDQFKGHVFPHSIFFTKKGIQSLLNECQLKPIKLEIFGAKDTITPPKNLFRKLRFKILNRINYYSQKLGLAPLTKWINYQLFDYKNQRDNGIWIRSISTRD